MDKEVLKQIFRKKSSLFVLACIGYLIFIGFLKWGFKPPVQALWYIAGGILGIFFLDLAEAFFRLTPSPFRSIIFSGAFAGVSFFVVTSSGSMVAIGLVLSLYLTLVLWQIGEWRLNGNIASWYQMVAGSVPIATQRLILIVFIVLFFIETFLFVR
jgi:hypothetical protein